jgi:hypothetical protein
VIGREQLGIVEHLLALERDQLVEPAAQPLGRRAILGGDRRQRRRDPGQPALAHCLAQRVLAGEVAVDAAVADPERARDVDHGGLARPEAAQHLLGGVEDLLRRQRGVGHARVRRSLSRWAISAVG